METQTYLKDLKATKDKELADLKVQLEQGLETLKDHLARQRRQLGLSLYERLKAQIEQTNNEAYAMYERRMNRTYPSETLKQAVHKSARVQLESMLRTGNSILENFKRNHLR